MKRFIKTLAIMTLFGMGVACGQKQPQGCTLATPAEFAKDISADSNAYILDVRTPQEYAEGHIEGAHNLDWFNQAAFRKGVESLPAGDTIYVYCRSGRRSAEAAEFLAERGYKVVDLDGGYLAWLRMNR